MKLAGNLCVGVSGTMLADWLTAHAPAASWFAAIPTGLWMLFQIFDRLRSPRVSNRTK